MGFRVQGFGILGFRVQGLGFRVSGLGFKVQGRFADAGVLGPIIIATFFRNSANENMIMLL